MLNYTIAQAVAVLNVWTDIFPNIYMSKCQCNLLTIRLISCKVWANNKDRLQVKNEPFCMLWVLVRLTCFYYALYIQCILFTFSGAKCESDINECDSAPCQNGGLCRDGVGGFQCQCKPGFVGKNLSANTDLQEQIATECGCLANFICLTTLSWYSCLRSLNRKSD